MALQIEHDADTRDVNVPVGRRRLGGHLTVPQGAAGVVLFAHGSGSGRFSPRNRVAAVVSRGGRHDLAAAHFSEVAAPTLLIVGGDDDGVLELNQQAYTRLSCPKQLAVIPGATHLFEEPGALDEVVRLARAWFVRY